MRKHISRENLQLITFVAVILIGFPLITRYATENSKDAARAVRDSNLRACEQVNNPNRRISSNNDQQFRAFIEEAVRTRAASAAHSAGAERQDNLDAARRYQARADAIKPLVVPRCETIFPEP